MTKITFIEQQGRFIGFYAKGHAQFNPGGPDILCSAISMATQMAIQGLKNAGSSPEYTISKKGEACAVINVCLANASSEVVLQSLYDVMQSLKNDDEFGPYIEIDKECRV